MNLPKSIIYSFLLIISLYSCQDLFKENYNYATPEVITDYNGDVFYDLEQVKLEWISHANDVGTTIQQIISTEPLSEKDQMKIFNKSDINKLSIINVSNETYFFSFDKVDQIHYLYFRFRTEGKLGISAWTKPINFSMHPHSELSLIPLNASVKISFTSEEGDKSYSGIAESGTINLDSILSKNNITKEALQIIRPKEGFIEIHKESDQAPFKRLAIGFSEIKDDQFPFKVLADTYPPGYYSDEKRNPELKFYHSDKIKYKNMFFTENMKMAYFLNEPPGLKYSMTVNFSINCYVKP